MSSKPGFIVIAEFQVKPDELDRFLELAHEDARQSLTHEADCHQFDVLAPIGQDNTVILHEAYTDRGAFDTHTRMPHYQPFKDGTTPLLAADPVVRFFEPV
ncbi:putative quinol monooxygenase [Salinisphaera sp. SPP-AMP-43]|uniref:putative quinol monooxygenase n=1 Tax=Salinisphaera sp. SPP-AMP-43 TaxID=3121288 RepID=UPI003C6DCF91